MSLYQILPPLAYAAAFLFIVTRALAPVRSRRAGAWRFPAALASAFAAFTLYQIAKDGLLMFWTNHSVNATGNQVWFDLLIAVAMAFALLVPAARQQGMALVPWAIFVLATASVGLLAMLSRQMYLQEHAMAELA